MTDQAVEETASISEENVLQHILDNVVAPQEEASEEVETEDKQDEVIEESFVEEESQDEDEELVEESLFRVTLSGGEVAEVTEEELLKGYSRNDDYTRKTMALADERKALEATISDTNQQRERLVGQIDVYISDKESQLKKAETIDLVALHQEDPEQAAQLKYSIDATRVEVAKAKEAREQQQVEAQTEHNTNYQKYLEAQQTVLLQSMPQLSDEKKAKAVFDKVNKAFSDHNFSSDEIGSVTDARAIQMAYKAALWDEAQAKRPEVIKKGSKLPKYQRSGSPRGKGAESKARYDVALKNAQATGSKEDVQRLILQKFKR